jgi:hypothetical protein
MGYYVTAQGRFDARKAVFPPAQDCFKRKQGCFSALFFKALRAVCDCNALSMLSMLNAVML